MKLILVIAQILQVAMISPKINIISIINRIDKMMIIDNEILYN